MGDNKQPPTTDVDPNPDDDVVCTPLCLYLYKLSLRSSPTLTLALFAMSTSAGGPITYPPAAHARTSDGVIINQPSASPTMSTTHTVEALAKPERLRGGCIPCPVSLRLRVWYQMLSRFHFRMEACASFSRVAAEHVSMRGRHFHHMPTDPSHRMLYMILGPHPTSRQFCFQGRQVAP